MPLNYTHTAATTTLRHMDVVSHNCMICQKVHSRPLLSIYRGRNTDNKGLLMMRLLHTEPQKLTKKDLSRGGNYIALCWGGKNEAGISELARNITFRNILFFIRVVSDSYAFNNIHPRTKERITQALGT